MSIYTGRLIHAVTIQNFTTHRDEGGQEIEEWHDGATIHAHVQARSSREIVASGAEMAEATVRVYVRGEGRSDITPASRLKCLSGPFKGRILDIVGQPIPDEKGIRLEILCKHGVKP